MESSLISFRIKKQGKYRMDPGGQIYRSNQKTIFGKTLFLKNNNKKTHYACTIFID